MLPFCVFAAIYIRKYRLTQDHGDRYTLVFDSKLLALVFIFKYVTEVSFEYDTYIFYHCTCSCPPSCTDTPATVYSHSLTHSVDTAALRQHFQHGEKHYPKWYRIVWQLDLMGPMRE